MIIYYAYNADGTLWKRSIDYDWLAEQLDGRNHAHEKANPGHWLGGWIQSFKG